MKITGPIQTPYIRNVQSSKSAETPAAAPRPTGDRVGVSSVARDIADARGPEVPDQARIEKLRQAIDDGTFEIDSMRIAEQMLLEEVE